MRKWLNTSEIISPCSILIIQKRQKISKLAGLEKYFHKLKEVKNADFENKIPHKKLPETQYQV